MHRIYTKWTTFPCFFTNDSTRVTADLAKLDVQRVASTMENLNLESSTDLQEIFIAYLTKTSEAKKIVV